MSAWSPHEELVTAAGAVTLVEACAALGLTDPGDDSVTIEEVSEWRALGAETYVCRFAVVGSSARREVLAKAFVPHPATRGVAEALREWTRRRDLLAAEGLNVPRGYTAHKGTVVEDFIPFDFWDFLVEAPSAQRHGLLVGYCAIVDTLNRLRFAPGSLHDLRTDGEAVFIVDFGQDLGPEGAATSEHSWLEDVFEYVPEHVRAELADDLGTASAAHLERRTPSA